LFPTTFQPIDKPGRRRRYVVLVAAILLVSAGVRLWHLGTPAEQMFDEVYYAKDAKAIVDGRVSPKPPYRWAAGDEVSWPHPELGKMAIAVGVVLFGDRAFGWRLPSVVAGMVLLACVYPVARRLGLPPPWALLALLFAAADPLGMAQSRIATLDVFVAAWTVACVYLALRYVQGDGRLWPLFACGAAGGAALATKWSGVLALVAAALILAAAWWAARRARPAPVAVRPSAALAGDPSRPDAAVVPSLARGEAPPPAEPDRAFRPGGGPEAAGRDSARRDTARSLTLALLALVAVPAAIYLISYAQYFLAGHTLADFRELHRQMIVFNLNLEATHTYASAAPTWIIDYRPVWYYFNDVDGTYRGIVAIGNPFLWWLATAALVAAPILALARRTTLLLPVAALIVVLYFPWFLATRTSFLYYMTPVAPFLAILVAAALVPLLGRRRLPRRAWLAAAGAALATALLWEPIGRVIEALGWVSLGVGVALGVALVAALSMPRLRAARPWAAMLLAGAVIGIVVAFIPVVLAMPISPEHFSRITWFPSWI
jgi:dolichyl-phosphate-mannose--protein O-mannosyl transferase